MSEDRAVSEVLGYVLVISLVTVLITVVMTMGIGGLESSQQSEQINNMERGFDVLSHNIEEMANREAPSRATELRIADGSIYYGDPVTINVTVDGELIENQTIVTEPLIYDSNRGTQIVYEGGAVIRTDGDRSTMLSEPQFILNESSIVIAGTRTRPFGGSNLAIDNPGTALIRGEYLGVEIGQTYVTSETLNVTVESERIDAWEEYFEEQNLVQEMSLEGDRLEVKIEAEETSVRVVQTRTRLILLE